MAIFNFICLLFLLCIIAARIETWAEWIITFNGKEKKILSIIEITVLSAIVLYAFVQVVNFILTCR